MINKSILVSSLLLLISHVAVAQKIEQDSKDSECKASSDVVEVERHHEDPTKIITKVSIGFNEDFTLSGSIGLDAVRKINVRINDDASHWKVGGSWLFDKGIVNANAMHTELDHGAEKDSYSIGTFIPLSKFGFQPFDVQIFSMFGFNKTDGDYAIPNTDLELQKDYILTPNSSNGGYIAYFALKPLSEQWTVMSFGGLSKGSDDYSGSWFGTGLSYKIDQHQSFNTYGFVSDDDYGSNQKVGFSYTYEFDGVFL